MSQQPTAEGAPRNAAADDDDELMDIIGGLEREAADDGDDDDSSSSSGRDEDDGSDSNASGHGEKGTSATAEATVASANPFHKADGNDRYLPNTSGGQLAVDIFRLVIESNNGGSNSGGGGESGAPQMKMIADKPRKEAAADDVAEEEVTQHPELKSVVDMVLTKLRAPASVVLTYLISDLLVSEEAGSPTSQIRKEVAALQPYRIANKSSSTSRRSVNLLSDKRLGKAGKAVIGERWGLDAVTAAAALADESGSPVSPTSPGSDFGLRGSPTHFLLHSPTTPHSSSTVEASKVVVVPPQKEEAGLKRNDSLRLEFPTTDSIAPNHLQPSQLMSLAYCAAFCGLVFDVFVDEAGNLRRSRSVEEEEEAKSKAPSTTTSQQQQQKQDDSFDEFEKGDGPVSEGGGPRLIDAEDVMVYPLWRVIIGKRLPEVLFSLAQMQEPRGPERHKKAAASLLKGLLDQIGGEFTRSAGGSHLRVLLEVLLDLWRRCVELEYTIAIQSAVPVLPAGALRAISHTLFKGILPHLTQAWTCWPRETIISTLKRLYSTLSISICMRDTSPQTNHHHHRHRSDEEHVGFLDGADMGRDVPPLTTALWRTWLTTDTHGSSFASLHSSVIVRWCSRRILLVCGDEGTSAQEQQQQLALLLADVSAVDVQKHMQQHDLTEDVMHRFVGMCCAA